MDARKGKTETPEPVIVPEIAAVPVKPAAATKPVKAAGPRIKAAAGTVKPIGAKPVKVASAKPVVASVPKPVASAVLPGAPANKKTTAIKITVAKAPLSATPRSKKDFIMDMTSSFTTGFQDAISEAQAKAKEAFEKSTSILGEATDFAKGNVEAVVESGKILAAGLQDMGSSFAAESRTAFETMTADFKELAAAKTPADFFKIQSELVKKSFDGAVAYGSKNSEAVLKLASEAFAPISGRVSLAVEKVRTSPTI